jgi:prevent-host-death family protein
MPPPEGQSGSIPETEVNVHAAKTHFSKLLAAVAKGHRITICKDGTPVAELGPLEPKFLFAVQVC